MSIKPKGITRDELETETHKLQCRIGGAYAAIAKLNAAVAKLSSDKPEGGSLYSLAQRITATREVVDDLAAMDEKLARVGYRRGGPARSGLTAVRTALMTYL